MGNEKISKDFIKKVNVIKAHSFGKDKKEIDSKIEYAAISVWLLRGGKNLKQSEREYLQKLKAEYEDRYIGCDLIGEMEANLKESLSLENLVKSSWYIDDYDFFNDKLNLEE